jgi:hypothetical protein
VLSPQDLTIFRILVNPLMQIRLVHVSVILVFGGLGTPSPRPALAETSVLASTWRGDSVCATEASACHNERVVYYIKVVPNRPDLVLIQADKIVDGKPITMGTGEWQYDRVRSTLGWRMPKQVWLLKINGSRMEGTLKLTDGTVLRNMMLKKDQ